MLRGLQSREGGGEGGGEGRGDDEQAMAAACIKLGRLEDPLPNSRASAAEGPSSLLHLCSTPQIAISKIPSYLVEHFGGDP